MCPAYQASNHPDPTATTHAASRGVGISCRGWEGVWVGCGRDPSSVVRYGRRESGGGRNNFRKRRWMKLWRVKAISASFLAPEKGEGAVFVTVFVLDVLAIHCLGPDGRDGCRSATAVDWGGSRSAFNGFCFSFYLFLLPVVCFCLKARPGRGWVREVSSSNWLKMQFFLFLFLFLFLFFFLFFFFFLDVLRRTSTPCNEG